MCPLFWPPSQLVALLGISAHMGPENLELPVAKNWAQLVTHPPTALTVLLIHEHRCGRPARFIARVARA